MYSVYIVLAVSLNAAIKKTEINFSFLSYNNHSRLVISKFHYFDFSFIINSILLQPVFNITADKIYCQN